MINYTVITQKYSYLGFALIIKKIRRKCDVIELKKCLKIPQRLEFFNVILINSLSIDWL